MLNHIPVLLNETLGLLLPALKSENTDEVPVHADLTIGCGNHAIAVYKALRGKVFILGLDADSEMLSIAEQNFLHEDVPRDKFLLVHANFEEIDNVGKKVGIEKFNTVFSDYGINSMQVDNAERGMSFRLDGKLDMRFDRTKSGITAQDIINNYSIEELTHIFRENADVALAKHYAKTIVRCRSISPIKTTVQLAEIIEKATPKKMRFSGHIHVGTKLFMALRIAVNNELVVIKTSLMKAAKLLKVNGRLATISYHSGEDKICKNFFRDISRKCKCPPEQPFCSCDKIQYFSILTNKPITPSEEEVLNNPRSRSGKLRGVKKLYETGEIK